MVLNGQSVERIVEVCDGLKETLLQKNADYGNSALAVPMFCQGLTAYDGIMVRLGDKFSRLYNLNAGHKDSVGESVQDTIRDIAGYCVLALIAASTNESE